MFTYIFELTADAFEFTEKVNKEVRSKNSYQFAEQRGRVVELYGLNRFTSYWLHRAGNFEEDKKSYRIQNKILIHTLDEISSLLKGVGELNVISNISKAYKLSRKPLS